MISSVFGLFESSRIGLAAHKSTRPFVVCATASINSKFGSSHLAAFVGRVIRGNLPELRFLLPTEPHAVEFLFQVYFRLRLRSTSLRRYKYGEHKLARTESAFDRGNWRWCAL